MNAHFYDLVEFKKSQPLLSWGDYNPVVAKGWLIQMEKSFEIMAYIKEQRVTYATYMLVREAEYY